MKKIVILCASIGLIWALAVQPVRAEIVSQDWQEFGFPVIDVFNCLGENGVATGMVHTTVMEMADGFGMHINSEGIVHGLDSGAEYLWRDNVAQFVPYDDYGNHAVGTAQRRLKLIGKGREAAKFVLFHEVHFTVINGQPVVYFDNATFLCEDPQS